MRKVFVFSAVAAVLVASVVLFRAPWLAGDGVYVPEPVSGVDMTCFEETSPVAWSFCLNIDAGSDNDDILFYLHARNGNATWWNDRTYHTGALYEAWRATGQSPPIVASVSFGKIWVLADGEADAGRRLYDLFINTVIPAVETKARDHGKALSGDRMIAGISMGGFNTLIVAMKAKDVFTKAAAICSPLPTVSHHDGLRRVIGAARRSDTSLKRAALLWKFSTDYFPKREYWRENDPLALSRSFTPEGAPAIYLTCGKRDDWGCFDGSEQFAANVKRAGGDIIWAPREGGHCDIDYPSLAGFLQHE
ncbi:MAG: alpha/beta hydrolase-fold protein [Pseudomonadota bacterium]